MNKENYQQLFELTAALRYQQELPEALRIVSESICTMLAAEVTLILMLNPRTRDTIKTVVRQTGEIKKRQYQAVQQQISGWIIQAQKSLLSEDLHHDGRFQKLLEADNPLRSGLGIPLFAEGTIIGTVILFRNETSQPFSDADLRFLEQLGLVTTPYLYRVRAIQGYFTPAISKSTLSRKYAGLGLIGRSEFFLEMLKTIEAAASCDVRVLLEGRSGSGKERVARAIHRLSARADGPFIAVDCGAIAPHLIESELFGYVKGAFTGATGDRKGLIEAASQGVLFLDEIANLPIETQAKLLRVLQEEEIRPVGSTTTRAVNVRIIAAASTSLRDLVKKGTFREDLFYRLHVYPIKVPALNERRADIPLLASHFLEIFTRQQKKPLKHLEGILLDFIQQRDWPGNVRELENFIERLVTLAEPGQEMLENALLPREFCDEFQEYQLRRGAANQLSLEAQLALEEKRIITAALESTNWNQREAARRLQISEGTLRYKMKKYSLKKDN